MKLLRRQGHIYDGLIVVAIGIAMMALGLSAARTVQAQGGTVYLIITLSDSAGHQFPTGSLVTVTATVSNSSFSGEATADPTVLLTYSTGVMTFSTNSGSWTCTSGSGVATCSDGGLAPGGGTTIPVVFLVGGNPGDSAAVTGSVTASGQFNTASLSSGKASFTDTASIANAGSYSKDAPPGSYGSKVGQDQIVTTTTAVGSYTFGDMANTIRVVIPANAVPEGAHLSLYKGGSGFWSSSLSSSSQTYVDGYAVAWTASGASTGTNAAGLVTMQVDDPTVLAPDHLYRATNTGVGTTTGAVASGSWIVSFTEDPGFVLGRSAAASSTSTGSSGSSTGTAAFLTPLRPGLPPSGQTLVSRSPALPLLVAGIFLVVAGTVAVGLRKRHA